MRLLRLVGFVLFLLLVLSQNTRSREVKWLRLGQGFRVVFRLKIGQINRFFLILSLEVWNKFLAENFRLEVWNKLFAENFHEKKILNRELGRPNFYTYLFKKICIFFQKTNGTGWCGRTMWDGRFSRGCRGWFRGGCGVIVTWFVLCQHFAGAEVEWLRLRRAVFGGCWG